MSRPSEVISDHRVETRALDELADPVRRDVTGPKGRAARVLFCGGDGAHRALGHQTHGLPRVRTRKGSHGLTRPRRGAVNGRRAADAHALEESEALRGKGALHFKVAPSAAAGAAPRESEQPGFVVKPLVRLLEGGPEGAVAPPRDGPPFFAEEPLEDVQVMED